MKDELDKALKDPLWVNHQFFYFYSIVNKGGGLDTGWKISYYPIFEDGKTGKKYSEPRALIEKPISNGTDFREVPLRYLKREAE